MLKKLEPVLYVLTVMYCFVISGSGMGDTSDVISFIAQRALFYVIEGGLLVMAAIRCGRLFSRFDNDSFKAAEKIFEAADCCFVMIAIVTVFAVVQTVPIFIFLPARILGGAANGMFLLLALTALMFVFYTIITKRFDLLRKKKGEIEHPLSEKTEDFFAFIHSADEKEQSVCEDMLDEMVPDEEDFLRHIRQISATNPTPGQKQLWECPFCGSQNPADSRQCSFCGADNKR